MKTIKGDMSETTFSFLNPFPMPIEIEQPASIKFMASDKFQNHFANVEVMGADFEPLHLTFTSGQLTKVNLQDNFGKTSVVFKPILKDGMQLKELEYALQRHFAEYIKQPVSVRPVKHDVMFLKWPRIKQGNATLLVTRGNKVEHWTAEDLFKALEDPNFNFKELVVNVNSYMREEDDQLHGGLYFTIQCLNLYPAPVKSAFRK